MDTAAAAEERTATEHYDQWEQGVRRDLDRALAWPPPDIAALMQQPQQQPQPSAAPPTPVPPPAPEPDTTMETTSTSSTSNGKANGMHTATTAKPFKPSHSKKASKLPEHGSKVELCLALAHLPPLATVRVAKRNGIMMTAGQVSAARWTYSEAVKALAPHGVHWHGKPLKLRPEETAANMEARKTPIKAKGKGHRGKSYSVPRRVARTVGADAARDLRPAPPPVRVPTGIATGAYEQQLRRLVMRMGFDAAYAYFMALRTELDTPED